MLKIDSIDINPVSGVFLKINKIHIITIQN